MLGGYEHEDLGLVPSTIRQLTMARDSKPGALISPLAFKGTRDACDIQTGMQAETHTNQNKM